MPQRPQPSTTDASSKKLKQSNLIDFMSSLPTRSSSASKLSRESNKRALHKRKPAPDTPPDFEASDGDGDTSDVGAIHFEPETITVSDSDDEELQPIRKKRNRVRIAAAGSDEEENKYAEDVTGSESDIGIPVRWNKRGKRLRTGAQIADTDSEEESRQGKHRFTKGVRPSSPEDLSEEVDTNQIIESRLRDRGKKTIFQKNLERIKRIKGKKGSSGQRPESSDESDDAQEDPRMLPFVGSKPTVLHDDEDLSDPLLIEGEEDDGFIVEDTSQDQVVELPPQFRNQQDLVYQFKIVCQLFVHLSVCPRKRRRRFVRRALTDEYFSPALMLVRRKMDGIRDSLVASSVWRPQFKKQLECYPELNIVDLEFALPTCDACQLGGRMSTRLGRLSGHPYDRETFESASESDKGSDSAEDESSEQVGPRSEMQLGRFCAARVLVFHQFVHWEYNLFQVLSREFESLRNNKSRGFVRVAFAGGLRPPDDLGDADGIMDWLDQRGVIESEWQKIQTLMESGRNLEARAKRGEEAE